MGKLIYSMSVSLDWVKVDEELHAIFNDEAREMSAFVYGRRMYELMEHRIELELLETRTFGTGVVYLGYEAKG